MSHSAPSRPYRLLFVCTGNICRSPSAEAVFRHYTVQGGLAAQIEADSAGTHGYHVGDPPDRRAVAAAAARGVSMAGLVARKLAAKDFQTFDLLLAMDSGHLSHLKKAAPAGTEPDKLRLFMDFAPEMPGGANVPDPYYGGAGDFEHALDLICAGAQGLVAHMRSILDSRHS